LSLKIVLGILAGGCVADDGIVVTVNQAQSFDVCAPTGGKVDDTKIIGGELTELYKNTQQGAAVTTNELFYISGQTVLVEIIIFADTDLGAIAVNSYGSEF
jgi:hypothetical protein